MDDKTELKCCEPYIDRLNRNNLRLGIFRADWDDFDFYKSDEEVDRLASGGTYVFLRELEALAKTGDPLSVALYEAFSQDEPESLAERVIYKRYVLDFDSLSRTKEMKSLVGKLLTRKMTLQEYTGYLSGKLPIGEDFIFNQPIYLQTDTARDYISEIKKSHGIE